MIPLELHRRVTAARSWPDMLCEFDAKFRHHARSVPGIPARDVVALRRRLIVEEAAELCDAVDRDVLPDIAKEAADLLYVVVGTMLAYGIDPEPVFRAVHESNMTKDPAKDSGGKSLKGPSYRPPDIAGLLRLQGWPGPTDPAPVPPTPPPADAPGGQDGED